MPVQLAVPGAEEKPKAEANWEGACRVRRFSGNRHPRNDYVRVAPSGILATLNIRVAGIVPVHEHSIR